MPGDLLLANVFQKAFQLVRPGEGIAPQHGLERRLFLFGCDGLALIRENLVHKRSFGRLCYWSRKYLLLDVSKRFVTFQYLLYNLGSGKSHTKMLYKNAVQKEALRSLNLKLEAEKEAQKDRLC